MSIYAESGKLVIDRRIKGERFKRATGLPDSPKGRDLAGKWDEMLTMLVRERGRLDVVRAIQRGALTFEAVWEHYRKGQWERIPDPEAMQPLFPVVPPKDATTGAKGAKSAKGTKKAKLGAIGVWLPKYRTKRGPISESHRASMRQKFRDLERLKPTATAIDLPDLLKRRLVACEEAGHGRTFNLTRAAVQAYLRDQFGKRRSQLWADVADIPPLPEDKKAGHPQTPAEARAIREALGPVYGAMWWSMCLTGMNWKEYTGVWRLEDVDGIPAVRVAGTKRTGRHRLIPSLGPLVRPSRGYRGMLDELARVTDGELSTHDGRRTFAHWLERAGVERSRRQAYLGHGPQTITDLYERHEVARYLPEDAAKLTRYLGPEPSRPGGAAIRLA